MQARPPRTAPASARPRDDARLLDALVFWRAVYRLRGPADRRGVIGVEDAMVLASHRLEILASRDRHVAAVRQLLHG